MQEKILSSTEIKQMLSSKFIQYADKYHCKESNDAIIMLDTFVEEIKQELDKIQTNNA